MHRCSEHHHSTVPHEDKAVRNTIVIGRKIFLEVLVCLVEDEQGLGMRLSPTREVFLALEPNPDVGDWGVRENGLDLLDDASIRVEDDYFNTGFN